MKFYLISGEASGDLHGANLIKALQEIHPTAQFRAWGGDKIASTGATLVKHYKDLAFMGFIEVIKNIKTIFYNLSFCKKDIQAYNPSTIILIDYPGFNLKIAKWAKKKGHHVIYYISPQLWAWHSSRVKTISKYVDEMITILPFEKAFYDQYNVPVHYVGHPLQEEIDNFTPKVNFRDQISDKPILLLMPGSRTQEISMMLPTMIEASRDKSLSSYQVVLAAVATVDQSIYRNVPNHIRVVYDKSYDLLNIASMAWVSSGTATLEAAFFKVPQVVCYKGNAISYWIAEKLINVPYISLVNLIAEQEIVKELIQSDFTAVNLLIESAKIKLNREDIIMDYENEVLSRIAKTSASTEAAKIICNSLSLIPD